MNKQDQKKDQFSNEREALMQSVIKNKLVLENAHDLIAIQKLNDLSYKYVNPTTLKVLGYSEEELLGKSAIEFIHPDETVRVITTIKENLEKGEGSAEFRYRKKDGSYIWLEVTAKLIHNANKNSSMVVISRDITERKRLEEALQEAHDELEIKVQERTAQLKKTNEELQCEIAERKRTENALKESEEHYRAIFENTGTSMIIINKDRKISMANSKFKRLSGYSQDELGGRSPFTPFVPPEYLKIIEENYRLRKLDPDRAPKSYEIQGTDKQGNVRDIVLNVAIIPDSEDVIVSLLDVTEQHQAELLTIESEERFRILFEKTPLGIAINRGGITLFANQAYLKMFGYGSISEIYGTLIINQVAPSCQDEIAEKIRRWEQGEALLGSHETVGQRKDGSTFPLFVEVTNILLPDGPANAAYYSDITEQHQTKKALRQQIEFQELLLKISKNFTNIIADDIDDTINDTLKLIGEFVDDDRSYVFLFSDDGSTMTNTHEWCAEGIQPEIANLQDLPSDILPWWVDKLRHFQNIYVPRVADLPSEAQVEKEILESQAIQSLLVVPIAYNSNLIGFLGFDSVKKIKTWSEESITILELVAQIIANALQRKKFIEDLKESKNHYRTIFENTGAATAILEEDLTISMINNKFEKLSGYSKKEIENKKKWTDFVTDEDQEMTKEYHNLRKSQPELAPREYELSFINRFRNVRNILI